MGASRRLGLEGIIELPSKSLRAGVKETKKAHPETEMPWTECGIDQESTPGSEDVRNETTTIPKDKYERRVRTKTKGDKNGGGRRDTRAARGRVAIQGGLSVV